MLKTDQRKEWSCRSALTGVFALLSLLLISGCAVPLNHIGAFSQASADLAQNAADAYERINESTIERRIYDIAADSELSPDENTFRKLLPGRDMVARTELLRGVEAYARALGQLAAADFREEIDTASKELYGALGKLKTTYDSYAKDALPLPDKSLSVIAASINAIGTVIVEKKRCEALKTVVIQADPAIQKSMALTAREFSVFQEMYTANLNTVWAEKIKGYQREVGSLNYEQRVKRLYEIRKTYTRVITSSNIIRALSDAGRQVAGAHAALRQAVENNEFTTDRLVKEIKNVVELSKSIKDFHDILSDAEEESSGAI
ncbi:hypothetical protein DENIS_1370 [Desulfonema ishimotonii]|uniref:Uncharacterized protein n=1 Tax=Desulfonema ishimotonii TaxID=45657 RepID=A0A401FU01_9BACT|nr:hypothetical protein [Desulfonema ishimotonii]GBC60418.1 hypothetical protein DENIS_1370 [Desulfonema ishimotonii]